MDRQTYCRQVLASLRHLSAAEQEAVRAELEAHIEDHACALLELGYDERLAEERTMAAMGDPEEVGREMERQYPRGWKILGRTAMVLTLLLALFLAWPLLERTPAAWESLQVRWAPKSVLDISQVREDFDPLGLDAWDLDAEAVVRDVHFRIYQAAYDSAWDGGGNLRLAVACWRSNPFQEALEEMDGYALRILVDGAAEGYSRKHERGGVTLYGIWAAPGQTLTITWEVFGETDTVSITLPEVGR